MLNDAEYLLVDNALGAIGKPGGLARDLVDALAEQLGEETLIAVCRGVMAAKPDAVATLRDYQVAARAYGACCKKLKMPYAMIEWLLTTLKREKERFVEVFADAVNGDTNAVAIVRSWLALSATGSAAPTAEKPAADKPAPIHPTTVAPPASSGQGPYGQRAAIPVGRTQTRPPADNVTAMPTRAERAPAPDPIPVQPTQSNQPAQPSERVYDQAIVYGRDKHGGTALQVELSPTRDRKGFTINLSIARAKNQRTQDGVNWEQKIVIMLVPHEVQLILSALMGDLPSARFAGHGPANDKWLEVAERTDEQWAGAVNVTVAQGKGSSADIRSCSISATDLGGVIAVFNRGLLAQLPGLGPISADRLARRVASLYAKAKAAAQLREQSGPRQAGGRG